MSSRLSFRVASISALGSGQHKKKQRRTHSRAVQLCVLYASTLSVWTITSGLGPSLALAAAARVS